MTLIVWVKWKGFKDKMNESIGEGSILWEIIKTTVKKYKPKLRKAIYNPILILTVLIVVGALCPLLLPVALFQYMLSPFKKKKVKAPLPKIEDLMGLNNSIEDLEEIKIKIFDYPVEEQARYADRVCMDNCKDLEFLAKEFSDSNDDSWFENYNATSVGNLAYVALYAPEKRYKDVAKKQLDALTAYVKQNIN